MENEDEEILTIYKKYKGKFKEVRKLNPKCKLFVCPMLPTRDQSINVRIVKFNKLIFSDLAKSNLYVSVVHGFAEFVDRNNGLLKRTHYEQRSENDVLHINDNGYRLLVRCIKSAIFTSRSQQGERSVGRPTYSQVVRPV